MKQVLVGQLMEVMSELISFHFYCVCNNSQTNVVCVVLCTKVIA